VERAEEALAQFSPEDHEIAKWLLTRLVRVGDPHEHADDKPVPFNLRDPDPSTGRVVDRLVEAGLLTSRRGEIRFANDGFVRSWQRLKEWIDDDREFLFWRQGLAKIASDWSDVRDPALLLKGSDLKMAENWLLRRKGDLLPIEIEFSQASRRKSKRWELVKQAMSIAFTVAVTGAIVYWAAERRWNPDLLGQASISGVGGVNLTPISSETLLTTDIAGARIWNAKSAQTLFSQTGSFNQSARGNYLLNVSGNDRSAEVVQTLTRVKYKIPFGPDEQPPFFDESEEFVLIHGLKRSSENAPATVRIWNLAAQQQAGEVKTPYAPQAYVTSAGDRFIDSWGLWDVRTGSLLSDLIPRRKGTAAPKYGVTTPSDLRPSTRVRAPSPPDPLNDGNVRPLSFGVSEKVARIVSLTGRKDQPSWLGLWDLKTGAELRSAPLPPALQDVFRAGGWLSVVGLSPDGSLVFLLGQGTGAVLNTSDFGLSASCPQPGSTLTGVSGGEQKVDTVCSAKDSPDLVLWDLYSPQPIVLKGFSLPTLRAGSAVVISGDQSRLLALRQTGQAELWDCGSGRKIRNLDLAYKDVSGNQVADSRAATGNFTMDGSAVSVRLEGGAIMLYAAGTGARLAVLQNAGGTRQEVYFDGACRRANVWTDTGRVLRYTEGKTIVRWFIPSKACGK
jgi:hypothetical protein